MAATDATGEQAGPIVVYAASGYTGRLISAELAQRGAELVLAGRDRGKLDRLAASLETTPQVAAVSLDDGAGLRGTLADAAAVIGCAGPFSLHGGPLIEAAAETGTNYLDTTGEQPFIRDSFERWGTSADRSGAALVSGMGFDYAPGDMLAALTSEGLGRIDELTLAYSIRGFEATRGTALSALEMIKGGDLEWRDGELRPGSRNIARGEFDFPSPIGSRRVGRYPSGEQITVPRHVDVGTISALIDLRTLLPLPLGAAAAPVLTASGLAMATPLRRLTGKMIGRLPEGPSESSRQAARYTIACEARHAGGLRRGVLRGSDVYGTTAVALAEGAIRAARPGFDGSGALAPAQAFDPGSFLAALAPFGLSWEINDG